MTVTSKGPVVSPRYRLATRREYITSIEHTQNCGTCENYDHACNKDTPPIGSIAKPAGYIYPF